MHSGHPRDAGAMPTDWITKRSTTDQNIPFAKEPRKKAPGFSVSIKKLNKMPRYGLRHWIKYFKIAKYRFRGTQSARSLLLKSAGDYAKLATKYNLEALKPIEILFPEIREKFNTRQIKLFDRTYFKASTTLDQATDVTLFFSDPADIQLLKDEQKRQFRRDSLTLSCSRPECTRRTLCFGARAIKERGGSSYALWDCYRASQIEPQ